MRLVSLEWDREAGLVHESWVSSRRSQQGPGEVVPTASDTDEDLKGDAPLKKPAAKRSPAKPAKKKGDKSSRSASTKEKKSSKQVGDKVMKTTPKTRKT